MSAIKSSAWAKLKHGTLRKGGYYADGKGNTYKYVGPGDEPRTYVFRRTTNDAEGPVEKRVWGIVREQDLFYLYPGRARTGKDGRTFVKADTPNFPQELGLQN